MIKSDEKTSLSNSFQLKNDEIVQVGIQNINSPKNIDINEALENAGFGCGTILYIAGSFLACAFDGSLMIVLPLVGPALKCEWNLTSFDLSCLNMSTYIAHALSAALSAPLGDRFGRRPIALVGAVGMTIFGVLCGFVNAYWQLLLFRVLIGVFFGIGNAPTMILSGEIPPKKYRALAFSGMMLAYGVGVVITSGIAYLMFGVLKWGWKSLMLGSSLVFSPCVLLLFIIRESPRYHYYNGDLKNAEETIRIIYKLNGKGNVRLKLEKRDDMHVIEDKSNSFSFREVIRILHDSDNQRNTLCLMVIAIASYFNYFFYGYSMPRILYEGYCSGINASSVVETCTYDKSVLFDVVTINTSEPLGLIITLVLLETFGRKRIFMVLGVTGIVLAIPLYFCVHHYYLTTFLFLLYPVIASMSLTPSLLISEYTPTVIRSTMGSIQTAVAGVGTILAMSSVEFALEAGPRCVIAIIQGLVIVYSISICMLKRETMGVDLL